jgi:hypothetical protein
MASHKLILPPLEKPVLISQRLFDICYSGKDLEAFKGILREDTKALFKTNDSGWTVLMICAYNGHMDFVKEILETIKATKEGLRLKYDIYHTTPSGLTALDLANQNGHTKIADLLSGETERKMRLKQQPTEYGFHETSLEAFQFIIKDALAERHPMIGGISGYFGGGIYFAINQQESSRKTLSYGFGFKCLLLLGNCYKIHKQNELQEFYNLFHTNPYSHPSHLFVLDVPVDIMRVRLLEKGYDSVWGKNTKDFYNDPFTSRRFGEEYVVYSADQIKIDTYYVADKNTFNISLFNYYFMHQLQIPPLKTIETHHIEWGEISKPKDMLNLSLVKPTRKANYYKIQLPDTSQRLYAPWTIEKTREFLNIQKGSAEDFQSGDIIDFSQPLEISKCIKMCFYIKYNAYEEWIPYIIRREPKYNYNCINVETKYKRVFISSKIRNKLRFLESTDDLYRHYSNLMIQPNHPNTFIVQYTDLEKGTDWKDMLPLLKEPAYKSQLETLNTKASLAKDESNYYLMVQDPEDLDVFKLLKSFQLPLDETSQKSLIESIK